VTVYELHDGRVTHFPSGHSLDLHILAHLVTYTSPCSSPIWV
jgi:hypothetical protein